MRANDNEVDKILDILSTYEAASGQKMNMEKSEVSFSRNIEQEKQDMLQMKLSFKAVEYHEKYLGLPTFVGSSKKKMFQYIQERVVKKLKGWKEGFLSQAGREILLKAVAQAIPTYAMHCFNILVSILNDIERVCRSFFWGQKGDEKKIAWVAWDKLYDSKREGGMGVRNLGAFNKAMLAKQVWRLIKYPNSLVAKVLKNKYFPNETFLEAKASPVASFTWKSILSAQDTLRKGVRKVLGKGSSIALWDDPWIPTLPSFTLGAATRDPDGPTWVSDVIRDKAWDVQELSKWVTSRECDAIMQIPIPMRQCEDAWTWHNTKNGEFSVRSAYYLELHESKIGRASTSIDPRKKVWKTLWSANVPEKIKHFGWRVLHISLFLSVQFKQAFGN